LTFSYQTQYSAHESSTTPIKICLAISSVIGYRPGFIDLVNYSMGLGLMLGLR